MKSIFLHQVLKNANGKLEFLFCWCMTLSGIYGGPEGTTLSTNLNAAIKTNSHVTKVYLLQT